ncbi:MAG: D-TA family PLP-dependent enzyme [Aureliella sp.]
MPNASHALIDPSELLTPCLLVYPDLIESNLKECIRIAGSVDRLRPHVKTHKTPEIVAMELALGITRHKCATLAEAQMLAECGVKDILIAYPQIGPAIARLADITSQFPKTKFCICVESRDNAAAIDAHFRGRGLTIDAVVDVDVGMHRTGAPSNPDALELYQFIDQANAIRPTGLHAYDGHNHIGPIQQREASVQSLLEPVRALVDQISAAGMACDKVVCGGTPTFPVFAKADIPGTRIELSPGTCVLSDYGYTSKYTDMNGFQYAAILMTRVISKQHAGAVTLDLGHKAIAADPPAGGRCHFLDIEAHEGKQNEEHLVIESATADSLQLGDVLYVVPTHICPTVALHKELHVVESGRVTKTWQVAARHRLY